MVNKTLIHSLCITFLVISCVQKDLRPSFKSLGRASDLNWPQIPSLGAQVTAVSIVNNQLVIEGSGFAKATTVTLKNKTSNELETFAIETQADNHLIINGLRNISLATSTLFDLIISNAEASSNFTITLTINNGSITAAMLGAMGATKGQVMKYNGTSWVASTITNAQTYLGTFDSNVNSPDLSTPSSIPGDYYIVSVAGSFQGTSYAVGDWIISDGFNWQKVANSAVVVSTFNGRRGLVTLLPADYVSLKNANGKIPNSSLNDLFDIDTATVAPINGSVLKYNASSGKWGVGIDNVGTYIGTANRVVTTDASGAMATSSPTTSAELGFLSGVTSNIQTQLNAKQTTTLNSGNILVGNAGNVAAGVALSGDAVLANTGALTLKNTGVSGTYNSVTTDAQGRVTSGTNVLYTGVAPVVIGGSVSAPTISMTPASTSQNGYLTSTNFITFSAKQEALSTGPTINGIVYPANGAQTLTIPLAPVSLTDAVNKQYVDGYIFWKQANGSGSAINYSSGFVGIGTSSPTKLLEVNGDALISGITVGKGSSGAINNTIFGASALSQNSLGSDNTAIGFAALKYATGSFNIGIGSNALLNNSSNSYNTAIGSNAGQNLGNGSNNVFIGANAGQLLSSSSGNVIIGGNTGNNFNGASNTILLADGNAHPRIRINELGNVAIFGANSNQGFLPSYALDVYGDINTSTCFRVGGTTIGGICTSDARLKENVHDFTLGLDNILGVRLRTYQFNGLGEMPKTGEIAVGVIAQELEKTNPNLVKKRMVKMHTDDVEKTEIKVVDYSKFTFMLINAVKELYFKWNNDSQLVHHKMTNFENQLLEKDIEIMKLKKSNEEMNARLNKLEKLLNK